MHREKLAKWLLVAAAISTLTIPIGVDAVLLANGHMNNPAWLPHAKLHCAMSFFAAASLGSAALAILKVRPTSDRFSMGLAAFLGSAFWIGLIAAGFWPGTSYGFLNDPVLGNIREPELGGISIYPNVVVAAIAIAIAIGGYWLTAPTKLTEQNVTKKT
ncbi:MAG: hypothetical protein RMY36_027345 [Nostoc sp. SerVER01]|nr:hypothetical protein [Nostoc sp. SerVER01]MDZ8077175.1 hypothetical protein [Nostoc sp. DedQUE01]